MECADDERQPDDPFERCQQRAFRGFARLRRSHFRPELAGRAEMTSAERVLNQSQHHANASGAETKMPIDHFAKVSTHQWPEKTAEVDPHVVDREPRVAPRTPFGI